MQRDKRVEKGFTLLEILLVIAAIGILAAIVLVAINPTKQLAQVRNTKRVSDINSLYKAIEQRTIDIGGAYPGDIGIYKDICPIGVNTNCVDLSGLVTTYIAAIPLDPSGGNYQIAIHPKNSKISIKAPSIELGRPIILNEILVTVEYLVVAGGGGGGVAGWGGGGGGAGGYRSSVFGELSGGGSPAEPALTLTAQSYSIVVGNGGLGGAGGRYGVTGGDSSFGGITSKGGGGGGIGGVSGSGGGASYGPNNDPFRGPQAPGSGTSGQGYGGGFFYDFGARYGGGPGGGASQPGIGGAAYNNSGGAGLASSITGNLITYANGGRAGGTDYFNGSNGAGYGYGGEGGLFNSGNGGSGIVIIRYKTDGSDGISPSSTGGTKTTSGPYTIHTFTTSGTFTAIQ